jgi:hypothetical protein
MKENQLRAKLRGLRKSKAIGFLIGGNFGGKKNGGGLAPTGLEDGRHMNLLKMLHRMSSRHRQPTPGGKRALQPGTARTSSL